MTIPIFMLYLPLEEGLMASSLYLSPPSYPIFIRSTDECREYYKCSVTGKSHEWPARVRIRSKVH